MSVHTRTHHTSLDARHAAVLHLIHEHKIYAIPVKIAEKYLVSEESLNASISSSAIFAKLEKKLTKAGALLKGLRTREDFSQVTFAKRIGVTQANLSNMENGRRPIGKAVAKRIGKIFGVDYRYFVE